MRYNAVKLITSGEAEHTSSSRSCLSNGKCLHLHLPLNAIKRFLISYLCKIVETKIFLDDMGEECLDDLLRTSVCGWTAANRRRSSQEYRCHVRDFCFIVLHEGSRRIHRPYARHWEMLECLSEAAAWRTCGQSFYGRCTGVRKEGCALGSMLCGRASQRHAGCRKPESGYGWRSHTVWPSSQGNSRGYSIL